MTNEQHNNYLAWTFVGHAVFQMLMTVVMMLFIGATFSLPGGPSEDLPVFFVFIYGFIFLFQLLFILPSSIAAYALFRHKSWARLASIIGGIVAAMNVPFGTAACAYSLWFFLGENWRELYEPGTGRYTGTQGSNEEHERLRLVNEQETRWTGIYTKEDGEVVFRRPEPPDWR